MIAADMKPGHVYRLASGEEVEFSRRGETGLMVVHPPGEPNLQSCFALEPTVEVYPLVAKDQKGESGSVEVMMEEKKKIERHPVAEALRTELVKLATEGDPKEGGALTPSILRRIMRAAKTGRDLLVSLTVSPSNLAKLVRKPASPFGTALPYVGQIPSEDPDADEEIFEEGGLQQIPYAPSAPAENFGMTAMREIIAATKNMKGTDSASPSKLVEALVIAREKGLDDVAQELERQLGVGKKNGTPEEDKDPKKEESTP